MSVVYNIAVLKQFAFGGIKTFWVQIYKDFGLYQVLCIIYYAKLIKIFRPKKIDNFYSKNVSIPPYCILLSSVPTVLSPDKCGTITNPYDLGNTFNNYFPSITETTKKA